VEEKKSEEPEVTKPRRFKIIDASYTGTFTIRTRVNRAPDEVMEEGANEWFRQETMIQEDVDYDYIGNPDEPSTPRSPETPKGLQLRKTKMKKVKIKRMRRTKRKYADLNTSKPVSSRTARTILALRDLKKNGTSSLGVPRESLGAHGPRASRKPTAVIGADGVPMLVKKKEEDKVPKDKFESIMTGFHTMSLNKVNALEKEFTNLKIFAGNVAVFFGEHDDLEWEELFKIFLKTFALIQKAMKQNADVAAKAEKERKRLEREKKKKERMAKRGLKATVKTGGDPEPTNILDEIRMRSAKGALAPSAMKDNVVGFEKVNDTET